MARAVALPREEVARRMVALEELDPADAFRCSVADVERERRVAERRRPRWIDLQVAALRAERKARPMLPAWAEWCRRARVSVGKGPGGMAGVTAWDAAARRAVALRLPAVVWGEKGGERREPEARPHRLGIDGYDVARWLPVGEPMQLYAPEWREEDTEVPPEEVGVKE